MLKYDWVAPLLCVVLGGICLSFSSGDGNRHPFPQNISDEALPSQPQDQATGRQEIADFDESGQGIHQSWGRMGDWNHRENWRYDRKAFFKGETQSEAYREEHPYGSAGIGYDGDTDQRSLRNKGEADQPQLF